MTDNDRPKSLIFNQALLDDFLHGKLEPVIEEKVADHIEARPQLLDKIRLKLGDGFVRKLEAVKNRSSGGQFERASPAQAQLVKDASKADRRSEPRPSISQATGNSVPQSLAEYSGYEILQELGRGGMGVVYLANNITLDRHEVLKVLNERLLEHEGAKERFLREIRAVSKLSHPHIVTSYAVLPLDDLLVFAMEHVPGTDLQRHVRQQKWLSIDEACSFTRQIALGLQHAHEKELVHRDIKPSNIMVHQSDGRRQVKILDFGLAKASSEKQSDGLTQDGTMLGTVEYASPEQLMNAAKADIRADIYSLGCTLYYMLTGRPPFVGSQGEVIVAHAQREPLAVNQIRSDIPLELVAVLGKMLAKQSSKRYQTPREVAAAMVPFVGPSRTRTAAPSSSESVNQVDHAGTQHDLQSPEKDTSVEVPSPLPLSLDDASRIPASRPVAAKPVPTTVKPLPVAAKPAQVAALPVRASSSHPNAVAASLGSRSALPPWFIATAITATLLFLAFTLWQLGIFTLRTPRGTITVENLPTDADVLVDGEKVQITWNQGQDTAEVSLAAGDHQLQVLHRGNEIYGDKVSIKGSNASVIKLARINNTSNNTTNNSSTKPSNGSTTTEPSDGQERGNVNWQSMFNGTDLAGWKGDPNLWFVRDGCIAGRLFDSFNLRNNTCLIWQGGQPQDFEIEFECKVTSDGNSGLQFRSQMVDPALYILSGYQADIDGKALVTGSFYDERGRGSLSALGEHLIYQSDGLRVTKPFDDPTNLKAVIRTSDWNRYRIVARGQTMLYFINDQLMTKFVDESKTNISRSGLIGLQIHAKNPMEVQFKSLRIRYLAPPDVSYSFAAGSVWSNENPSLVFTVRTRQGDKFTANFKIGTNIEREIQGTIRQESVMWRVDDVKAIAGASGRNNFGTLIPDPRGDRLIFTWEGNDGKPGSSYELIATNRSSTSSTTNPSAVGPSAIAK